MRSRRLNGAWRASPSPEPTDESGAKEWEVDRIVSEEYDAFGCRKYEIRWNNWERDDGTDTSWHYKLDGAPDTIDKWDRAIARRRRQLAAESCSVAVPDESCPLHMYQTFEFANALDEKMERSKKDTSAPYAGWDDLESILEVAERETLDSTVNDSETEESSEIRRSERVRRMPSFSYAPPRKKRRTEPSRDSVSTQSGSAPPTGEGLEQLWKSVCQASRAADLTIANEVTAEPVPCIPPGFRYIEDKWLLGEHVSLPDPGFLETCECPIACRDPEECSCLSVLDVDANERKTFAYDSQGVFKFDRNRSSVIVECNKRCRCDRSCPNKVAQHPRDVPIQIFRTDSRGWGVRAPVSLNRGKFVGLYTGLLIHRDDAAKKTGEHKSYIFDLDALETEDDSEDMERYSVDAYKQGNWTRFINHSCDPNLQVQPVVWDTPISMNRPYLAFFITKYTPAFTELTIDYDPRAAGHNKGKRARREGDKPCMCGSVHCRGWISV